MFDVTLLYIFLIAVAGAFLQTNIGFGFPVLAMIFLPMLLPFQTAVALCQIIASLSLLIITVKYFSYIAWKLLLPLLSASMIVTALITATSFTFDASFLTMILAFMLILLSIYFFIFSNKIKIQPTVLNGTLLGAIAGIGNGLFSIGGPMAALYLLPAAKQKESYLVNIQFYFLVNNLIGVSIRLSKGALHTNHIPLIVFGWAGIALGTLLGMKSFEMISLSKLKKMVYSFVGISGLMMIISSF